MKGRDGEGDKPPRSQEGGWPAAAWKRPGCPPPPAPLSKQAAPEEVGVQLRSGGELVPGVTEGQGGS